jgi:signal transduction histidine kinase
MGEKVGRLRPMSRWMNVAPAFARFAWVAYAIAAAAAAGAYLTTTSTIVQSVVVVALPASAIAAIAFGVRIHRPADRRPWTMLAIVHGLWALGWVGWQWHILAEGAPPPTQSPIILVFIGSYPVVLIALKLLMDRREPDVLGLVDVGLIAAALTAVTWVWLGAGYISAPIPVMGQFFQLVYAFFDVLVFATLTRTVVSGGRRSPSFWFLTSSVAALLASDLVWNWSTRVADYAPGSWADAGWLVFAALGGVAALHPSMSALYVQQERPPRRLRMSRLLLVLAAVAVPPLVIVERAGHLTTADALPAGIATALVGVFVVLRLALVLRETEQLRDEFAEQNQRLRKLDSMKDDFVSSVSHEFRTPLTSIRGYLELVLESHANDLTDEQRRYLGVVDRNSDRLLRLVGDLLFVAEVDAGKISVDRAPVDVAEVVHEAADAAAPVAEAKGVQVSVMAESGPSVSGDRGRLAQLLDNLIGNAIKFTPAGGRVDVRAYAPNGVAVIEVADTGIGIPKHEQTRLFERFFRARAATDEAVPGTGLGLSISKAIVDAHGGSLVVASEEGAGTTFRIEFPLRTEEVTE